MSHLVLYDGVCGLCNHFVQFLLRIDRRDQLRFAALQGPIGTRILASAGRTANALSTVIVVVDYELETQRILDRSDAGLFAVASAGGLFRAANALGVLPRFIRDAVYDAIAKRRYGIFGRLDACPLPTPASRAKFLDFAAPAIGH